MIIRTTQLLFFFTFTTFSTTLLGYVTYFDRLGPAVAASPQVNSTSDIASQIVQLKNIASNQSSDIKDMKKLMSQEVQLLKSMGQEFDKTATQSSFAALGVFFLGLTLVIFGLKLTLKATDKQTSRYFKAMKLGLIIPVTLSLFLFGATISSLIRNLGFGLDLVSGFGLFLILIKTRFY